MEIESIHHIALTVSDLERSKKFYREILALKEIDRPNFSFAGAWFQAGASQQLHLIVHGGTFRGDGGIDTRDVHFAVRVKSYRRAMDFLRSKGFREDAPDSDPRKMKAQPRATAGFPQVYIMDPDRHVIEINAAQLD